MSSNEQQRERIRWRAGLTALVLCTVAAALPGLARADSAVPGVAPQASIAPPVVSPGLADLAARHPQTTTTVIMQLRDGETAATARELVKGADGALVGELPIINAVAATMPAGKAKGLGGDARVKAITTNAHVKAQSTTLVDATRLANAYDASVSAETAWNSGGLTGKGVGVAVIDTGISGDIPDFRVSASDTSSRVVATAVVNPLATSAGDPYGHGTHVAGIIAGNSWSRGRLDLAAGKYVGVAPDANLISIKAGDDLGDATILDVIYGLQFAVDHKDDYTIRVVNLSLLSSDPQSYKTDPLDAAVEAAWFKGIVVVAAAGNRGQTAGAVDFAPANDPYAITVGGVDDMGTNWQSDDVLASWSSGGKTQDGIAKPEVVAPGAHIVSTLAPGSAFTSMCPTCIVDGAYIRAGGTSMATPVVSGAAALLLQKNPALTPNEVKGALMATARPLDKGSSVKEIVIPKATTSTATANAGLTPNVLVSDVTGEIDYTRSSWSRSSWSTAPSNLIAGWARSSWSCSCSLDATGAVLSTRSSWGRSSWSSDWSK